MCVALATKQMSSEMSKVVKGLDTVLSTMDAEKIGSMMDSFGVANENIEVRTQFMSNTIASSMASSTPEASVTGLLQQVGEEIGLQVSADLSQVVPSTAVGAGEQQAVEQQPDKVLS